MEKNKILDYITKLQQFEKTLNGDTTNTSFIDELNSTLQSLSSEINTESISSFILDVKVKKLSDDAVIPSYSKDGDAGMDLTVTRIISETEYNITYGYDIAFEIPRGYVGLLFPRSSVRNKNLVLSNCVGVIDSGFRGEIQTTFKKISCVDNEYLEPKYYIGERACQIIILPYPRIRIIESKELSDSERGDGGFGSTGK